MREQRTMRHEVIVGVERRRRWSDDQKLSILSEVGVRGATVADVARRHDLTRQHMYQWRHELRRKGLCGADLAEFLPVEIHPDGPDVAAPAPVSVEIVLSNGRCLRGVAGMAAADLVDLIRVVEGA